MCLLSNKTVLVTGATGLIGSHVVDALIEMGNVKVIALSRSTEKLKSGFAKYHTNSKFSYIAQDISLPLKFENTRIDLIFHAAGLIGGKVIANTPIDVINPNLIGTINCLELLRNQEKSTGIQGRLIYFSSITVYGNIKKENITVSEEETAITEVLEAGGAPYSQSKRMAEVIIRAYQQQYNIDAVIARLSLVYGHTVFMQNTAFLEFINRAIEGKDITLNSSGAPRRDNIYIDDAISALLLVAQNGISGESYNISSNTELGNFAAIDEIAQIIADTVNKEKKYSVKVICKTTEIKERKSGIILNNTKLKALGWSIKTSLPEGIAQTIRDYNIKISS